MIQTIQKRDGRIVGYNEEKIKAAIRKAMLATSQGEDESLIQRITDRIGMSGKEQMTVEDIQDRVEIELMKSARKDVAKKYIAYRDQRSIARQAKTRDIFLEIIETKNNDITRENANMNADTPAGMMMKFASETTKPFVDDYLLAPDVKHAVKNNLLHIHDKDYYPTKSLTCVQHPLDRLLENGYVAGHAESRAPKRIETAGVIACISLETAQNEMHGGQAIPAFDFYLAPFVRVSFKEEVRVLESLTGKDLSHLYDAEIDDYVKKDLDGLDGDERLLQHAINRTVSRVHQAMEAFIHNMNTIHSRGGNQVVFSSINYGTDTSAEGRCVIREVLNCTYEGVGNGATAIFPIQIWKKKRGVSYLPEDPNYDLYRLACDSLNKAIGHCALCSLFGALGFRTFPPFDLSASSVRQRIYHDHLPHFCSCPTLSHRNRQPHRCSPPEPPSAECRWPFPPEPPCTPHTKSDSIHTGTAFRPSWEHRSSQKTHSPRSFRRPHCRFLL